MKRIAYFTPLLILVGLLINSCSGYRVRNKSNPFEEDQIRVLAVPIFVNKSIYPGVGPAFTRELTKMLSTYSGLKIQTTPDAKTDGVLLGIISSPQRYRDAYKVGSTTLTSGALKESIGNRAEFNIPTNAQYKIGVRLALIKNPTTEEKKLLLSQMGDKILKSPRIIFNQSLAFQGSFNLESRDTIGPDSGGVVNYTKTKRFFHQTIENLAEAAATNFETLVINVF